MSALDTVVSRCLPCELCGGRDFQRIGEQDRCGRPLQTHLCCVCGLISHAEIPTDKELTQYYAREYRQHYHGEFSPAPHRVIREWNRGRTVVRLLTPYLRRSDQIIEIGCGMGATVKQLELAGFAVEGIEPGDSFRSFGTRNLRAPIRAAVLADLPPRPEYDFALLLHVLEHLNSPAASLQHIRSLLRPGGRLFIEVPNAGAPHAAPNQMFHFAHIFNFTADTLTMLVEKTGFRVHDWLSGPREKNLRLLVTRSERWNWRLDPAASRRARHAVTGHTSLSYHLRGSYLRQRIVTFVDHCTNHVLADSRLRQILRRCA
jgi:SAM-dependent methyltransferase